MGIADFPVIIHSNHFGLPIQGDWQGCSNKRGRGKVQGEAAIKGHSAFPVPPFCKAILNWQFVPTHCARRCHCRSLFLFSQIFQYTDWWLCPWQSERFLAGGKKYADHLFFPGICRSIAFRSISMFHGKSCFWSISRTSPLLFYGCSATHTLMEFVKVNFFDKHYVQIGFLQCLSHDNSL